MDNLTLDDYNAAIKCMFHLRASDALLMLNVCNAADMKQKDRDKLIRDLQNDYIDKPQKRQLTMNDLQKLLK